MEYLAAVLLSVAIGLSWASAYFLGRASAFRQMRDFIMRELDAYADPLDGRPNREEALKRL